MTVVIRSYQPADLHQVTAIWRASRRAAFHYIPVHQAYTPEDDLAFFRDVIAAQYTVWLAEHDQRIVGFMALNGAHAGESGPVVLEQLFIAVDRQRQGIGTLLVTIAKRLAPRGLRLFAFQRNEAARVLYERHGFTLVRFGVSPAPENEPDVEYQWVP